MRQKECVGLKPVMKKNWQNIAYEADKKGADMAGFDSMTELFLEECTGLLQEYVTVEETAKNGGGYSTEDVNELFRITHTIKGDATMMLYESIAVPSRAFEQILVEYRSQGKGAPYEKIAPQLRLLYQYIEGELKKLEEGKRSDGDGKAVARELLGTMEKAEKEEEEQSQRFYIAPERTCECVTKTSWKQEEQTTRKAASVRKRSIAISEEELGDLQKIVAKGNEMEARLRKRYQACPEQTPAGTGDFFGLLEELRNWLETASMEQLGHLTVKLRRVIEEMADTLGKEIELTITGGDTLVERNRLGKISGALLHLLRNCADHGIELPEERVTAGKVSTGHIFVRYRMTDDASGVIIEVEDDGAGISGEVIERKAKAVGIDVHALTEQERLHAILFAPGFSTSDPEGVYSGRGVGLDAAKTCFEEFGGTLTVESREGHGTCFVAEFPYAVKI